MFNKVISKRTSVLVALLMLGLALMAVSANSAYATHPSGPLYETDFGTTPAPSLIPFAEWTDGDGTGSDCRVKNVGGGEVALQLAAGCAAYVTVNTATHQNLRVEYYRGHKLTGRPMDEHGELRVHWKLSSDADTPANWTPIAIHVLPFANDTQPITIFETWPFDVGTTTAVDIDIRFWGYTANSNHRARVDNLVVIEDMMDYLPDGTVTYTQGYYGSSPQGEQVTCDILTDAEMDADDLAEIRSILWGLYGGDTGDISTDELLCLFLVGEIGPGSDDGYLPAGKLVNYDHNNLAAQKITLLLNVNLDVILTGDDIPIEMEYFLNIDAVLDLIDGVPDRWYDPILTTFGDESLGTCTDTTPADFKCDDGTVTLSDPLGLRVQELDDAVTTVQDMEDAALYLLEHPLDDDRLVNGVLLTRIDVINILSLINKSYDAGVPTAFVIFPNNN